jgi:F-type H+-transporting ATPase subunit b
MPQISQLGEVLLSQLFWLGIALGFIFFVIGRGMVPRIQATVDAREKKIAGDLEEAQTARAAADETEAGWRARMDSARAEAARLAQDAKQKSAEATETKVKAAADQLNQKSDAAQASIRQALSAARAEIEAVAADATGQMVERLTGLKVDAKQAAAAVKAAMHG